MGFVRRFQTFPAEEVITAIEGVVVVDLPPPASIEGVGTGVVALVGEFPDMQGAVAVSSTGVITTDVVPQQIFSSQDLQDKVGGFDETLGEFGGDMGNGFVELRSKKFAGLVVIPVNLSSASAGRVYRELPTCKLATDPTPVVPLQAAAVAAGREFKLAADRLRLGTRHVFSAAAPISQAVDGAVTTVVPAVIQLFDSAGAAFDTDGTAVGDLLVVGVIGGAGPLGTVANTYRITAVTSGIQLTVELLDGASFDWITGSAFPYRVHPASAGDSGAVALATTSGYKLPNRPLDATIAAASNLGPTVAPPAATGTSWDPLSGLRYQSHPSTAHTYVADLHAPNAANNAAMEAAYTAAMITLKAEKDPARTVNIFWAARKSSTIQSEGRSVALDRSAQGLGLDFLRSPSLDAAGTIALAIGDAYPGVGAYRNERVFFGWPGVQISVPEAVGFSIAGADGSTVTDGLLDVTWEGWVAAVLSNLAPERNPGQAADPIPRVLAPVLGFQRAAPALALNEYIQLRTSGVVAPRFDRTVGTVIQSGITSSLVAGEKNINRRRMADFIEDSVSAALLKFNKLPLSNATKDGATGEVVAFLSDLESVNNPAAQRISGFVVDDVSGNTPSLLAKGIFVIIGRAQMLATADFIVFQAEVGPGVDLTT